MFRIRNTTRQLCGVWVLLSSLIIGLTGCAAMQNAANKDSQKPTTDIQPAARISITGTVLSDGSIRHDTNSARVAQLWAAVEKARANDNAEAADRYLKEAISISPEDAVLWSRAAEIKLTLLEPALAENYAAKSNVYSVDNPTLQHRNWLIIEHARELRGDLLGVRDAHKMVQKLQR